MALGSIGAPFSSVIPVIAGRPQGGLEQHLEYATEFGHPFAQGFEVDFPGLPCSCFGKALAALLGILRRRVLSQLSATKLLVDNPAISLEPAHMIASSGPAHGGSPFCCRAAPAGRPAVADQKSRLFLEKTTGCFSEGVAYGPMVLL